ncbi:DUF4214 domain-containing protein [Clostridium intestinale]|uniref:DUF4214 domain-containing protein n=1 Tax=Clostridium intestinale URNW TaxID=1294142 RepID=U2N9J0_9CLOT|nr:DUF4214 domain-containing protein [Clostridium intestinale]ERK32172.1 hypothetical protein CINTURNW_0489 [Clostridium intestinale URNW]
MKRKNKILLIVFMLILFNPLSQKVKAYTGSREYISNIYKIFLQRDGTNADISYWEKEVNSKKISIAELTNFFLTGDEFKSKNISNEDYVKMLYKVLLGRDADSSGLNTWVKKLNDGYSRKYLLSSFFETAEFKNSIKDLNVEVGTIYLEPVDYEIYATNYVNKAFMLIMNRLPDENGYRYWVNGLVSHRISCLDLLTELQKSKEYKSKQLTNEQFIKMGYEILFGRSADNEGLNFWTSQLNSGYSRNYLLNTMANSNEFNEFISKSSLLKGEILLNANDRRPEIKSFVLRMYLDILSRQADQSGADYWTDRIIEGSITPAELVDSFVSSPEFVNTNMSYNEFLNRIYKGIMGRNSDSSGINYWLEIMLNGYSRRYVLSSFINSQEFTNIINSYGLNNKGEIYLSGADIPFGASVYGITKNFVVNIKTTTDDKASTNVNIPLGSKIVLVDKVKGNSYEYYKIRYKDSNNQVYEGYIRKKISGYQIVDVINDNEQNEYLGILSEVYESNGDPGAVSTGNGDPGGKSYGVWQLSSKVGSLDSFISWLYNEKKDFYNVLITAKIADGNTNGVNFDNAWKTLANDYYIEFYNLQHKYIKLTYYDQLLKKLMSIGDFDGLLQSFSIRNVLWSTAVQHGATGAFNIISKFKNVKNIEDFINAIYDERGRTDESGKLVYFPGVSDSVANGVKTRFINEKKDALRIYKYEGLYINN